MQTVSKLRLSALTLTTALCLGLGSLLAGSAAAAPRDAANAQPSKSSTEATSQFCTNLANKISTVNGQISNLVGKINAAQTKRSQDLSSEFAQWDQQIAAAQAKADSELQADFAKIAAKAKTPAEQAALQTYETAINNAVSARRSANAAARTTFRNGVESLLSGRVGTVNSQVAAFQNAVQTAEATATSACQASPTSGQAIRSAFVASMESARNTYVSSRHGDGDIAAQVKQLAETRDAAIKTNDAAFKAAVLSATQALKAAFGKTTV